MSLTKKRKTLLFTVIALCVLVMLIGRFYFMRYQMVGDIINSGFSDEFNLHRIRIDSALRLVYSNNGVFPITDETSRAKYYFMELHLTSHDRIYDNDRLMGDYLIMEQDVPRLLEALLQIRVRPINLRSHPIWFNASYRTGIDVGQINPYVLISYEIRDANEKHILHVGFDGSYIIAIRMGEIDEDGWWESNNRVGFNAIDFKIHEDDQAVFFEILNILDSKAAEVMGFEH